MAQILDINKYNGKPNILIGGDVCGIQNYIYQIVSRYAAKSLKGRSFYVQLLTDAIVRYMLDNLKGAELVYNSGGSFFIIAPKERESDLDTRITEIENALWERHRTSLYVAIAWVDLDTQNIENNLNERFAELFEKRDQKKFAKFADKISDNYGTFFTPQSMGCNNDIDEITGEYFDEDYAQGNNNDRVYYKPFDNEREVAIRKITDSQILLGEKLRTAKFMTITEGSGGDFNFLDYQYTLDKNKGDIEFNVDNVEKPFFYAGGSWKFQTFDDLCDAKGDDDFKRLGVLRMDVDNLGEKFLEFSSFKEFQDLSNGLYKFFGKTIDAIKTENYSDTVFIIYSGGDDVFAVGDWKDIMSFAEEVRTEFVEQFKGLTISAGMSLITLKSPIMKGAEYAGDEEKRAKAHNNGQKNAISFFQTPLDWHNEFTPVKELKNAIVKQCKETGKRSFIQKILQRWSNAEFEDHSINNKSTYWLLSYDIKRLCERVSEENRSFYEKCIIECCKGYGNKLNEQSITTYYHLLELWALACRWAELELRCETA